MQYQKNTYRKNYDDDEDSDNHHYDDPHFMMIIIIQVKMTITMVMTILTHESTFPQYWAVC